MDEVAACFSHLNSCILEIDLGHVFILMKQTILPKALIICRFVRLRRLSV